LDQESPYSDALTCFEDQTLVTVACGTTTTCLGDERNLREFLVADETAQQLRQAGHAVISLLIDDSLDPLDPRHLRIAFNGEERLIEKWVEWCGKPLAHVPDPWECHPSYAAHFEDALLDRLQNLGCSPNLVSTASLYDGGLYEPYVTLVLQRHEEIRAFLAERFSGYEPERLFWLICPKCGYIDQTRIEQVDRAEVIYHCDRCEQSDSVPLGEVKGKLNWKLDCAVRWVLLGIDAEPFSKAYLEPRTGSFAVAQALSKTFFGGHTVQPLHYGLVRLDKSVSYRLLPSLPPHILRRLFTDRATADLTITPDYVMNLASRAESGYGLSYLECVKQLIPMWLLRPHSLTDHQRHIVASGIRFAREFMGQELSLQLPTREIIEEIPVETVEMMQSFLADIIRLRESRGACWEAFCEPARQRVASLGENKSAVISHLRAVIGQKQGVPAPRLLFLLPVDYLEVLEYILDLRLAAISEPWSLTDKLAA